MAGPERPAKRPVVPYAELHSHSNFSFLDGASHPAELVQTAAQLGLEALAVTDHDGLYAVARVAEAAREVGLRTVYGAELTLGLPAPQNGVPDPAGEHLLVLARGREGYRRLARVISSGQLRGEEKGKPVYDGDEIVEELAGHAVILTGCRKGLVRRELFQRGPMAASMALRRLVGAFGREHVAVELTDHGMPLDSVHNELLADLAEDLELPVVATTGAHYATRARGALHVAVAAVRAGRSVADMDGWLPPAPTAYLRSGAEMAEILARFPTAVPTAARLGRELAFDLALVAPRLPPFPVPDGHTEASLLRHRTLEGAARRYGHPDSNPAAYRQLEHELNIIEQLDFPGYFLIVDDLVGFCRQHRIFCQGRGSAANSAVCYALGITNVDPIAWKLLFERFLSAGRVEPPDIDLDIEAGRREEVIQYVYARHGRRRAAQVANVITYRPRSAVREIAKALGYAPGQQDAWAKVVADAPSIAAAAAPAGTSVADARAAGAIPADVAALAGELEDFPRHLGIHSGGMVLSHDPVSEVCPVEWARMPGRTVLQWDKDDCAQVGLVKFDLLGLGMLSALRYTVDLVEHHHGVPVDLAHLDLADQRVYRMLCAGDAVGVFQVESRAQLQTLPRLKPRTFWDLAVEIALIRPGPIQGGSVHPYLERRAGARWAHPHPLMAGALDSTLGVPLFQEQVMRLSIDLAGFTAAEADELRRAMGSKRSRAKMQRLRARLNEGMARNGITGALATRIYEQIEAFSGYGFPQSHALSFAHIVFSSAWLKCYYPAAFCAGLLRAQPMGFYSPQSLVADARRHGVRIRPVDLHASTVHPHLEPDPDSTGGQAIRIGLAGIHAVGEKIAQRIVDERTAHGLFADQADLVRRCGLTKAQLETLATAGALAVFGADRRRALWEAGAAARERSDALPGTAMTTTAPVLPGMTALDLLHADLITTGLSADQHPADLLRASLSKRGALRIDELATVEPNTRVSIGGVITHRQRPPTARGVTFLNVEDETGMLNVVVSAACWTRHRELWRSATAALIRGMLRITRDRVLSLDADLIELVPVQLAATSRDFR